MKTFHKSERGQALIFIVFGLIIILALTALAIDGGMVYSDRRQAQNVADAASLAGGGAAGQYMEKNGVTWANWNCSSSKLVASMNTAETAAINRADSNSFAIDEDLSDWMGVEATCDSQAYNNGFFVDRFIDITTRIETTTDTSFAQLFTNQPLVSQVEAVTRVRPRQPLAFGHAIVALNTDTSNCNQNNVGVTFGGSMAGHINGGGVFSNGCLQGSGNNWGMDIEQGGVAYVGSATGNTGGFTVEGDPYTAEHVSQTMPQDAVTVPPPNCNDPDAETHTNLQGSTDLDPGLHCVTGTGNAIKITSGHFYGTDVTIYVISGDVEVGGGVDVNLAAPMGANVAPALSGILFYVSGNGAEFSLTGNSTSSYLGVIYAPHANVSLLGANGTTPTFNTQIIGYNVTISGNADIDINFDLSEAYARPTNLELAR